MDKKTSIKSSRTGSVLNPEENGIKYNTPILLMKRCNAIKTKAKSLFKQIDTEKTGLVKGEVFFDIIGLHKIRLRDSDIKQMKTQYTQGNDRINYKQALAVISVDMSLGEASLNEYWIIRNGDSAQTQIKRFMESQNGSSVADNMSCFSISSHRLNALKEKNQKRNNSTTYQNERSGETNVEAKPDPKSFSAIRGVDNGIPKALLSATDKFGAMEQINMTDLIAKETSKSAAIYSASQKQPLKIHNKTQQILTFNEQIKRISDQDPERFLHLSNLMKAISDSFMDIRKLESFRNRIFITTEVSVEEFKSLLSFSLNLPKSQSFIVDEIIEAIQLFRNSDHPLQVLTKEMIDDFFNLCHYWPTFVKRDSNVSAHMYKVLSSTKAKDYQTSFEQFHQQKEVKNNGTQKLLDLLQLKIDEKFYKFAEAYKFFAGLTTSKISFNDFVIGIENLRMKMTTKDISEMFDYLDENKDGYINYQEFCNLSEEKRKGIDPFQNGHKTVTQDFFKNDKHQQDNQESTQMNFLTARNRATTYLNLSQQHKDLQHAIEDHEEGPIGLEKDAMVHSFNVYRGFQNRKLKREINLLSPDCYGIKSLKSDNIKDILSYAFTPPVRSNTQSKGKPANSSNTIDYSSNNKYSWQSKRGYSQNKVFNRFHTKASSLRLQSLQKHP